MGEINIPGGEQDALRAIDTKLLDELIEQCLYEERLDALRTLRLDSCGPYPASRFREYEKVLAEYVKAKSAKKRAEMEWRVRCAGSELAHAVQQMKHRMETEENEGLLFYIDDKIMPPYRFSDRVAVRVGYRWRQTTESEWVYGSVTFTHDVNSRPDYATPLPKRKLGATKEEQERQNTLYREWEHLMKLGLHSVREYFRGGGSGAAIPQSFQAKTDSYTRGLNNYSVQFWL